MLFSGTLSRLRTGATVCVAALAIGVVLVYPRIGRAQAAAQSPELKTFDLAADPEFKDYKKVMTRFALKHRPAAENTFCILGFSADDAKSAWVLWREGREIILWEGGSDLSLSRRVIHLKSDVVPTEADLHGSTYLVTKPWVDGLSKSCERVGVKIRTAKARTFSKK
jgi:hypothetical protein